MAHASSLVVRASLTPPAPRGFRYDRTSRSPQSPETSSPPPPTRRAAADIGSSRRAFTTTVAMTTLPFVFSPPSSSTSMRAEAAEEEEKASSSSSSCVDNPDAALAQARALYGSGRLAEAEDLLMRATQPTSSCDADTMLPPLFKLLARNVVRFSPHPTVYIKPP